MTNYRVLRFNQVLVTDVENKDDARAIMALTKRPWGALVWPLKDIEEKMARKRDEYNSKIETLTREKNQALRDLEHERVDLLHEIYQEISDWSEGIKK